MFSLSDTIVYLWLLPVVLQIIFPLAILAVGSALTLFKNLSAQHRTVIKPLGHIAGGAM